MSAPSADAAGQRLGRYHLSARIGGGPTGVELAGALAEIARDTLSHEFRSIDPADAKILLLEGADQVLPAYPGALPAKAKMQLEQLGVTVKTGTLVIDIQPDRVTIREGERVEHVLARTVLWGAGVQASDLGRKIGEAAGIETDRIGRITKPESRGWYTRQGSLPLRSERSLR